MQQKIPVPGNCSVRYLLLQLVSANHIVVASMPASQLYGVYVMLVGIGGLLILIGLLFYFKMRRPFSNALQAPGLVVDQEEYESDGVTYSPIVKFTAQDGRERTFTDAVASYPALFKVGEEVRVYY